MKHHRCTKGCSKKCNKSCKKRTCRRHKTRSNQSRRRRMRGG